MDVIATDANNNDPHADTLLELGPLTGPVLVFGGPYGNLQATQAMQAEAGTLGIAPGNVICTGDTVAYCADPAATVTLLRQWGCHVVMGNCEQSVGFELDDCGCGFEQDSLCDTLSRSWYAHAVAHTGKADRAWMRSLPKTIGFSLGDKQFSVVHGAPGELSRFIFPSSSACEKREYLSQAGADVMVGGHCGVPFGQAVEATDRPGETRYWLNAGAIGMPANDGDPRTWYLLLDCPAPGSVSASWRRLDYDHAAAARSMLQGGLDTPYREALSTGIWPSMSVMPPGERAALGQAIDLPAITLA